MSVLQDIRLAFRLFRRTPVSTAIVILSIALSVGMTAVVFTAIKSVLIAPLPYARAEELVQIGTAIPHVEELSRIDVVFWDDMQEVIKNSRTLASAGVYGNALFDLAGDSSTPPEALYGLRVSSSLFPTLGVAPMLGRYILPEEDQPGHASVIVLSYGLWIRRFNSDRSVIGRIVKVDSHDCTVIGVMPPGFNFPLRRSAAHTPSPYVEFWAPLPVDTVNKKGGLGAVARLRPGVSLAQAQQDLASISATLAHEFPLINRDRILRMAYLHDRTLATARKGLWLLMAAALMFLLIGCANAANLLLARGFARQQEIAVRLAIGAGRTRIVRQLLTESCVLAGLGGLAGYVLTTVAWKILPAMAPVSIPRLDTGRADWTVFGFTLLVALINGLLFGIAPALRAAGWKAGIALQGFGARGAAVGKQDRIRSTLVSAEVAVSVLLVVIGGQLLGSFVRLLGADPGFRADRVLASVVLASPERYRTAQQRGMFYRRLLDSVRALPGVASAGTVDALPFSGENHSGFVSANEASATQANAQLSAEIDVVSEEYLKTMGVRLAEGRWFREGEMSESSNAAIVNDFAASRLWPGSSAIGKQICVHCTPDNPRNWKQVIGVIPASRHSALDEPVEAEVYLSGGALEKAQFLIVRTDRPMGGYGESDPTCNRRDRSESARISQRVHAVSHCRFSSGSAIHHDAAGCYGMPCSRNVGRRCLWSCFVHHFAKNAGDRCSHSARGHSQGRSCNDLPSGFHDGLDWPRGGAERGIDSHTCSAKCAYRA